MMIIKTKLLMIYVLGLCAADSATTLAVVKNDIGYEANSAISHLVYYPQFHIAKFLLTLLMVYLIHKICNKNKRLEFISYLTLIMFYSMVVLNNVFVYTLRVGFGLDLPKMFLLFAAIFGAVYFSVMSAENHQIHIE